MWKPVMPLNTLCHSKKPIPIHLYVLCIFLKIDSPAKLQKLLAFHVINKNPNVDLGNNLIPHAIKTWR